MTTQASVKRLGEIDALRERAGALGFRLAPLTKGPRAEFDLLESEELNRLLVETAPVGIVHAGADGSLRRANAEALRFFGITLDELARRKITDFADLTCWEDGSPCPPDRYPVTRAMVERRPQPAARIGVRRPDGGISWAVFRAAPIFHPATGILGGAVVAFVDITESRRAHDERQLLEARLREAQRLESLALLAGSVAHDFNNLLAGILGHAELAQEEIEVGSSAREPVDRIHAAAQCAADITRQLLDYAGRGRAAVEPSDISRLAGEMAHLMRIALGPRGELRLNLSKGLPAALADATQIRQALMNLIANGADALESAGGGVITISSGCAAMDRAALDAATLGQGLPEGGYVWIEVEDSGCGMDEATRGRIFDPFFTTKADGRGLGLATILGILRAHHGAIKIDSVPGHGTTIRLLLPALSRGSVAVAAPAPAADIPIPDRPAWRGSGAALVVDDDPTARNVARMILQKAGFEVIAGNDGAEGVELFRLHGERVRLVLLDLTMPKMNGEQTFVEMRRLRPDLKVILTSGYQGTDAVERLQRLGLEAFLAKPYTARALLDLTRAAVG